MNNQDEKVSITDLHKGKIKFFIPRLQRGYRWKRQQIKEMLSDLDDFLNSKSRYDGYYCLQPLILSCNNDETYKVIDGQQRLVSMYLISYYLFSKLDKGNEVNEKMQHDLYNIYFENDGKTIFDMLNFPAEHSSLTERYVNNIYVIINELMKTYTEISSCQNEKKIYENLNKFKFIQHYINEYGNEEDIFTNVNMGKLPLNNAEKIKGLMFKSVDDAENVMFKQNASMINEEWSLIEHKLHDDDFFKFFTNSQDTENDIRINVLFDLFALKIYNPDWGYEKKETFALIENYIKSKHPIETIESLREFWQEIKSIYYIIEDWYNNDKIYHYLGYLINFSENYKELILELIKEYDKLDNNKELFFKKIKGKIKETLKYNDKIIDIEKLKYEYEPNEKRYTNNDYLFIKKILLLFNIENILQDTISKKTEAERKEADIQFLLSERFSFNRFKDDMYQLEHIHSRCDDINDKTARIKWLDEIYEHKEILNGIDDKYVKIFNSYGKVICLSKEQKELEIYNLFNKELGLFNFLDNDDSFNLFARELSKKYTDCDDFDEIKHNIGNLTLLDRKTNQSYKNSVFPIKVKTIKEINTTTRFIPIATRNVMLKYYTKEPKNFLVWNKVDMDDYVNKIKEYLSEYLEVSNG